MARKLFSSKYEINRKAVWCDPLLACGVKRMNFADGKIHRLFVLPLAAEGKLK
ncbi:MAG: hypothetical protein IKJ07_04090 [Clostridia bacterium]|nr:hypothetical protein [Clostridia bacterium]